MACNTVPERPAELSDRILYASLRVRAIRALLSGAQEKSDDIAAAHWLLCDLVTDLENLSESAEAEQMMRVELAEKH